MIKRRNFLLSLLGAAGMTRLHSAGGGASPWSGTALAQEADDAVSVGGPRLRITDVKILTTNPMQVAMGNYTLVKVETNDPDTGFLLGAATSRQAIPARRWRHPARSSSPVGCSRP